MKTSIKKPSAYIITSFFLILSTFVSMISFAQEPTYSLRGDQGAFEVYTIQNLSFGAFTSGSSGGTLTISNSGSRSSSGDVISLNLGVVYCQAVFEIEAPEGTIFSILNGPNTTLTGSNGGSMSLSIGASYPASPFNVINPSPARTSISLGGILTVGNMAANPAGSYTGNFYITFNQE